MLCQICQKRVGNVHFTKVINNSKVEMYICEECARENGHFGFGLPLNINDFFNGILGIEDADQFISKKNTIICEKCKMSYEEFQKTGKVGCENCYNIFGEKLDPLIKRLHGSLKHNGKIPSRLSKSIKVSKDIDLLKEQLSKAITSEEYEKAAEIRDKIKVLEANGIGNEL